jgi:Uma2 family endonuclease
MAEAARREDWPRTVPEFELWHARQPERWEFYDDWPRLMAPAAKTHTIIKGNVFAALRTALAGTPCHPLVDRAQILTDEISAEPTIIVEVMSPSSEYDDGGRKWFAYRKIRSLKHYFVPSQQKRELLVHSRAGEMWQERFVTEGGASDLDDPPLRLAVDDLYALTDVSA